MRLTLSALMAALLCAGAVCAQPVAPQPTVADELGTFIADKGILGTISDVGSKVGSQASDLVASTLGFLGVPYRRGGATLETGFDCSGFVKYMFEQLLINYYLHYLNTMRNYYPMLKYLIHLMMINVLMHLEILLNLKQIMMIQM